MQAFSKIVEKRDLVSLLAIFLIGLFIRLLFVFTLRIDVDEGFFLQMGYEFSSTSIIDPIIQNFPIDRFDHFNQPPLVSILYVFTYWIFPLDPIYGRLVSALLSSLCIVLAFLIMKNIWDSKEGLIAASIIALDPSFNMQILMNMDSLTNFIFCCTVLAIIKVIKTDSLNWHIISGVFFGLCMLTKWNLAILPLIYVGIYIYNFLYIEKNDSNYIFKRLFITTCIALSIFLPWFLLMWNVGAIPTLFGHLKTQYALRMLFKLSETWLLSSFLVIFMISGLIYNFLKENKLRLPLLVFLFVLCPFYLLMPRYNDYALLLYFFVILAIKPVEILINQSYDYIKVLKNYFSTKNDLEINFNGIFSLVIIGLFILANFGFIAQSSLIESDYSVQESINYVIKSTNDDITVICPRQFGPLLYPRNVIYSRQISEIGEGHILIYSYLEAYDPLLISAIEKGSVEYNDTTYNFVLLKKVNVGLFTSRGRSSALNSVFIYNITISS